MLDAAKEGLIVEYPVDKSPHFKELVPAFQDKWGPKITVQVIGIGYNPNKIKTPPKSWDELWDPKYKGRVGLTAMNSQLGIAFAELNRIKGGSEPTSSRLRRCGIVAKCRRYWCQFAPSPHSGRSRSSTI